MGFPTKVQLIKRKASEQWYINSSASHGFPRDGRVDRRGQRPARAASLSAPFRSKLAGSPFEQLWNQCLPAFDQRRVADRAQTLALSSLLCLGRHTVTGLLTTSQFQDWSAAFRRIFPMAEIFSVVRRAVAAQLPAGAPFRAVLDDSLLRRSGLHTPGVAAARSARAALPDQLRARPSVSCRSPPPCPKRRHLPPGP